MKTIRDFQVAIVEGGELEEKRKKIEEADGTPALTRDDPPRSALITLVNNDGGSISHLETIRTGCPALHSLFLPDETWEDFKAWHQELDHVASHRSMLLALERGHLARLTGPIHRYLIQNGAPHPALRRQYAKSLREKWMFYEDLLERHRKSRSFTGLIVELLVAEWLETLGWTITGLEAFREGPDIEARTGSDAATAFEIKAIGTEDFDFEMMLRSLAQDASAGFVSPYAAMNYLLFRVYEAAKQLVRFNGSRIAVSDR